MREGRRGRGQHSPRCPCTPRPRFALPWGHREPPRVGLQERREPRMECGTRTPGSSVGCPTPHTAAPRAGCAAGRGCSSTARVELRPTARFGIHPATQSGVRSAAASIPLGFASTVWEGRSGSHRSSAACSIPRGCKGGTGSRPRGDGAWAWGTGSLGSPSVSQQLVSESNTWPVSALGCHPVSRLE